MIKLDSEKIVCRDKKKLIIMLWSFALSEVENKLLDPNNIEQINEYIIKLIIIPNI